MTGERVELHRTTFTTAAWCGALLDAWPDATQAQAGVLWAQYALETGRGAACWNNNLGNVKHVSGDGHDYVMLPSTWEIENGRRVVYQPPDPQTWFRAYDSLGAGMVEHLAFLRRHYASAWAAVDAGDPALFASLLRAHGYYTGSEDDYRRALVALHAEFMAVAAWRQAVDERAPTDPPEAPGEDDAGQSRRDALSDAADEAAQAETNLRNS